MFQSTFRTLACACILAFSGLFLVAQASPSLPQGPLVLVDATGTRVSTKTAPVRLVSLTLYSDEVLLDLVEPGRIAALSVYARDPHLSNLSAAQVQGKVCTDFNVEFVLGLRPDLVFVADWSDAAKVALLRKAGVPVFVLATPTGIDSMKEGIRLMGTLCRARPQADALLSRVDARLALVAKKVGNPATRPSALDYNSWGSSNGKGSSWDELLSRAGLANAVAKLPTGPFAQVNVSREIIVTLNPDLVFVPDWNYGADDGQFLAGVQGDPVLSALKAWKNHHVHVMPERLKSTVSHYMVDTVEYLAATAWPHLFPAGKEP